MFPSASLLVLLLSARITVAVYPVSDAAGLGPRYDGIGGLSGGGATSRLLIDYPEPYRTQILDLLFLPNFGASLQLLKIEVGGDGQSTEGSEASHMHSVDDFSMSRGYEFFLAKEAKARRPDMKYFALSWAWPAWVGCPGGDLSSPLCDDKTPYTYPAQTANYTVMFIKGAAEVHNITIDVIGSWNERGYNAEYLITLRAALDAGGLSNTAITCDDFNWACAIDMMNNSALFAAVDYIGAHDVEAPVADQRPGKPMYDTEGYHTTGSDAGAASWITELNTRFILYNQSLNIAWNLVTSYYEGTSFWPHGLMHAFQPWAGWYIVPASIWATAHYTQFSSIGWSYLRVGEGSGFLTNGGSYVTLCDSATSDFSIIIEKMPGDAPGVTNETATFALGGSLAGAQRLAVWSTRLNLAGASPLPPGNASDAVFKQLPQLLVTDGTFTLDIAVGQIYTITTLLSAGHKGSFPPSPPPSAFPPVYSDDFNDCALESEAKYITDFNGGMECVDSGDPEHGIVMQQMVPAAPIRWWTDTRPHAVVGDATWTDCAANISFRCTNAGGSAMLALRASLEGRDGPDGISAEDTLAGLWLSVGCAGGANGEGPAIWNVTSSAGAVGGAGAAFLSGALPGPLAVGSWHNLSLAVLSSTLTGAIDGVVLFSDSIASIPAPTSGWVGLGTQKYGDLTQFDDLSIRATGSRCSQAGSVGGPVAIWPCNAASPGQLWQVNAVGGGPWGTLSLSQAGGGGEQLCLSVSQTKNQYGSFEVELAACDATSQQQLWSVNAGNSTITTQGGRGGPGEPNASICLDMTAGSYSPGTQLDVFPCQPANQQWIFKNGLISGGDPTGFFCVGGC